MLFASRRPSCRGDLNDHPALTERAVARRLEVECALASAMFSVSKIAAAATAIRGMVGIDVFGVGLQADSARMLPVAFGLADKAQLSVQVMSDRVVVSNAHRDGVESVGARPRLGPRYKLASESLTGSRWRHSDYSRFHLPGQTNLCQSRPVRAHRDRTEDIIAINENEYLGGWILRPSSGIC